MPGEKRSYGRTYTRPQTAKRGRRLSHRTVCSGVGREAPLSPNQPTPADLRDLLEDPPSPASPSSEVSSMSPPSSLSPPCSPFCKKRCTTWFQRYASKDNPKSIGPEGVARFCSDIGVHYTDVVMLVISWLMLAKEMGYIKEEEWLLGFTKIECDNNEKVVAKVDYLRSLLKDPDTFKSIYRYAFDSNKELDRSMLVETSKGMLKVLLADQWSLFIHFTAFLDDSKYRAINKDQWVNIFEFARSVNDDLSNYDEDGAWPVMLDDFVEWLKNKRQTEGID